MAIFSLCLSPGLAVSRSPLLSRTPVLLDEQPRFTLIYSLKVLSPNIVTFWCIRPEDFIYEFGEGMIQPVRLCYGMLLKVKVAQLCPTLCDPMDYTVRGILQARTLEWVAFPFCRGSSQPRGQTQVSHTAGRFFTSWATREAQEYWRVAYPFSRRSSWPRNRTGVSCIAGGFLIATELSGKPYVMLLEYSKGTIYASRHSLDSRTCSFATHWAEE